jgi:opacity protein-like surface antigen
MKKLFILMFALVLLAGTTQAQKGSMAVGINAGISLPMGSFGDAVNMGFGGQGEFMYMLNNNLALTGSIGYLYWGYDDAIGFDGSFTSIPILFGARYYFGESKTKFYGLAKLGIYASTASYSYSYDLFGVPYSQDISASDSDFGFAFGAGVKMPIGNKLCFDAHAKYNVVSGDGWIDIMAGVDFAL